MRVRLSQDALSFLRKETRYLKQHSPAAARRLLAGIDDIRSSLARFPRMGPRADDEPVPGSRRLVLGDYVLSYDIDGADIAITAIRHGRMQPEAPALDDDFDYESDQR
jgi:plasmid stabilization system protein ParE